MTPSSILDVDYYVNGITVYSSDRLLTGTVGDPATTTTEGQTLRLSQHDGTSVSTFSNPGRPSTEFNEDLGFFNGYVYAAHYGSPTSGDIYGSPTSGDIYKIDPTDLTSTVSSFHLGFGVVGMTIVNGDIWITDWGNSGGELGRPGLRRRLRRALGRTVRRLRPGL